MAEIHDKLQGLLEDAGLRRSLEKMFCTGIGLPGDASEIDELSREVAEVMQTFVIDRLSAPSPLTVEDLTSIAVAQLAGLPSVGSDANGEFASAYQRFVTFTLLDISSQRTNNLMSPYDLGADWILPEQRPNEPNPFEPFSELYEFELWSSKGGFSLCGTASRYWECRTEVFGRLKGYCTERAMERVESALKSVVGSAARTAQLCVTKQDFHIANDGLDPTMFTPIGFLIEGDGRLVMSACLSAYFQSPGAGEDTLLERLRNAVVLLSHADEAGSDPVALSLSFAAIEALVCEKDEAPVNKQIKKHVSTLLVENGDEGLLPDKAKRKACERVLGKLYDVRCQVMHGNHVEASDAANSAVRRIAAGVVRSVACWRASQERSRGVTSWKEFMDEIVAASRKPGKIVGVPAMDELVPVGIPR